MVWLDRLAQNKTGLFSLSETEQDKVSLALKSSYLSKVEQKWLLALFLDPGPYSYSQALPFVWTEQAWPLALLHCLGCEGSSDWPCVRHIWMILLLFTGNEIWSVNTCCT